MKRPDRCIAEEAFDLLCEGLSDGAIEVADWLTRLGRYPAQSVLKHPHWATFIAEYSTQTFDRAQLVSLIDAQETSDGVRLLRAKLTLRLLYQETRGLASIRATTREFSELAGACVDFAIAQAREEFVVSDFCVLGLGKVGGFELNYGSDIDLIYAANDVTETTIRFANLVTDILTRRTDAGFLFRVDLRLRPEGTTGQVVQSVSAMKRYYLEWGRTWERGAMMKARPIAGNVGLGETFLSSIEPFLYKRHLDFESIDALKTMKAAIEENARQSEVHGTSLQTTVKKEISPMQRRLMSRMGRRGSKSIPAGTGENEPGGWDVKIGRGGIREIEFFVQALQLVHCGRSIQLRTQSTLEALQRLLTAGLISDKDHELLSNAYDLYRRVEHCVQLQDNQQTHVVPGDEYGFEQIARRLGFEKSELEARIAIHRDHITTLFSRLFSDAEKSSEKPTVDTDSDVSILLTPDQLDAATRLQTLNSFGFVQHKHAIAQLRALTASRVSPFSTPNEFAEYLLQNVIESPNPDLALSQLTRFIQAVGDRPGYFSMLRENPHATRLLVHVLGGTRVFASSLIKDPNIFGRLLSVSHVAVERDVETLSSDLAERLTDAQNQEHRFGIIRRFHQEETLRVGIHLTGEAVTGRSAFRQLSDIADVVLAQSLHEIFEPLRTLKKSVTLPEIESLPFVVIGLGKYGGRELGFGSDLDLMFVYEDDRQYRLSHPFFAKIAQRLIRTISASTDGGRMYAVDTRLRPSGQQGALVVSLEALGSYHETEARVWERQALIRSRVVAGNPQFADRFNRFRRMTVFENPLPEDVTEAFRDMLMKIRAAKTTAERDVKYTRGGLVDIEFATQFQQLVQKVDETNTGDAMEKLLLDGVDVTQLRTDYDWLRKVEALIRMSELNETSQFPQRHADRLALARRCGFVGEGAVKQLEAAFDHTCGRGRTALLASLGIDDSDL